MNIENHILEAFEIVSTWGIPDEDFAHAVNDQARLMAGIYLYEYWEHQLDIH